MNQILEQAKQIKDEIISCRRILHQNPEVGDTLPKTKAFVIDKLKEYGYNPTEICESGIVATIEGSEGGKTILLRADMDALPMQESTSCEFKSTNGAITHVVMICIQQCYLEQQNYLKKTKTK